ncbi:MAG: NUDIX hydrolase [Candidatus Altiarchaeota archaeon]
MEPVTPKLVVDGLIARENEVVLIKRLNPPFQGCWALPGGFVDVGETVESACVREMTEETSLEVEVDKLAGVYSDPKRDPRGHSVSVVFICKVVGGELKGADDASEAKWFPLDDLPELAFDHSKILSDYIGKSKK